MLKTVLALVGVTFLAVACGTSPRPAPLICPSGLEVNAARQKLAASEIRRLKLTKTAPAIMTELRAWGGVRAELRAAGCPFRKITDLTRMSHVIGLSRL